MTSIRVNVCSEQHTYHWLAARIHALKKFSRSSDRTGGASVWTSVQVPPSHVAWTNLYFWSSFRPKHTPGGSRFKCLGPLGRPRRSCGLLGFGLAPSQLLWLFEEWTEALFLFICVFFFQIRWKQADTNCKIRALTLIQSDHKGPRWYPFKHSTLICSLCSLLVISRMCHQYSTVGDHFRCVFVTQHNFSQMDLIFPFYYFGILHSLSSYWQCLQVFVLK